MLNDDRDPDGAAERDEPELLATVLRRAFAEWTGPCCPVCGLPALLHGERCADGADPEPR